MKKKGGWLVIGIIIIVMVVLIVGYFLQQSAKANLLEVQVTYSFGSSWAGWIDTLIVNNNGSVVLQEQIQNNNTIKSLQLSNDEDKEFRRLVVDANIFSLKDEYTCAPNCPTDVSGSNQFFI